MRKNEVYEMEITGMTDEGAGVGRAEGMAVFVPYTIMGETVRVIIVKVLKNYAFGKLLEVIRPSAHRTKAQCPYFYTCGGCQYWHMDYEQELEVKRQKVQDCLRRIGGLELLVEPVVGAESVFRYRNKAQFPVTMNGIGFYRHNSHQVIDMEDCIIQGEANRLVIQTVRAWMEREKIPAYDETRHTGVVRHVYTRSGQSGMVVVLVTRTHQLPAAERLIQALTALSLSAPLSGVVQNINADKTNVVLGRENKTLWGQAELLDAIGDIRFKISPLSFYQVNPVQTQRLYHIAKEFAGLTGREVLWDMYCGIGTVGLYMADRAARVIGVEVVEPAVENARENAELNGISNAQFVCGTAEQQAPLLLRQGLTPDVVVLDPPRKGCDAALLDTVAQAGPRRIVYISCKPSTLARDLKLLAQKGYVLRRAVPVDMFPRTAHVETVVLMSRVKN